MKKLLIRNPSSEKKFNPHGASVCSFTSYRNTRFWQGIDLCFGTKAGEKISGIEITEEGITATFEKA